MLKKLRDDGLDGDTIVVFTTDNGAENFTWPDGGQTPFAGGRGDGARGGLPGAVHRALAGQDPGRRGREPDRVGAGLVPDPGRAGGQREHRRRAEAGKEAGGSHVQGPPRRLRSDRPLDRPGGVEAQEIYYFAEGQPGAVRIGDFKYRFIDQPGGWLGGTVRVDMPLLTNLRLDPFERTGLTGSMEYANWFMYELWRFVFVQQEVARAAQSFIDFPPMQRGASFNLEAVKDQVQRAMQAHHGQ